ncbi:MAG: hypothetical protein WCQ32_01375 [bacterium]
MSDKTYTFQDRDLARKASVKGNLSRPKTYRSKRKIIEEVQKELIREELLQSGFLQQVGAFLPKINAALIKSAMQPTAAGAADRRTVYTALKILKREKDEEPQMTMGQVLADLAKQSER